MNAVQKETLPTEITIGDRTYEVLGFDPKNNPYVEGYTMAVRAKEMNANLGKDDGQYFLDHQDEIPVALRAKVVFLFTDWHPPINSDHSYYVWWNGDLWVKEWNWLDYDFLDFYRVLRRQM